MRRLVVSLFVGVALAACTGGDMGNTRGGGAAPGQSGGRDTGTGSAGSGAATSTKAGATGAAADTTKRANTNATKRP